MSKKFIAATFASSILLLSATSALAQNAPNDPAATLTPTQEQIADLQKRNAGKGNGKKIDAMDRKKGKRMEFQKKLSGMSDERKKSLIQRIDAKLIELNNRRTTHLLSAITRLETILAKIKEKAAAVKAEDTTTTALDQAITDAESALATAKEAVMAQQAKDYAIELTTETQARASVGRSVSGLQADLRTARQAVIAAKQTVMKAAVELAKLRTAPKTQTTPSATEALTPTTTEVIE